MSADDLKALGQHFLLRHLPEPELSRILGMAARKHYADKQTIFSRGDPGSGMMAVLSGRVRIVNYSADGKEVVLRVVTAGEVIGEITLIDGGDRTADAVAMGPTELLFLSRRDFLPFLEDHPRIGIELLKVLCARLRGTSEQLEDFTFLALRPRLAKVLLRLIDEHGKAVDGGIHIDLPLSQNLLAAMMGTSREAVNKQLREWEETGIVALARNSITITDQPALEALLEDEL
ncbi:MAG: Crp/Fnr family transcriptional regulator [Magnetospiraceae bacterium]